MTDSCNRRENLETDRHDLVKEAFTAGMMAVYAEWKEVCECCPDPKHASIPEAADQYCRDLMYLKKDAQVRQ